MAGSNHRKFFCKFVTFWKVRSCWWHYVASKRRNPSTPLRNFTSQKKLVLGCIAAMTSKLAKSKISRALEFYRLGVLLLRSVVDQWFRLRLLLQVGTLWWFWGVGRKGVLQFDSYWMESQNDYRMYAQNNKILWRYMFLLVEAGDSKIHLHLWGKFQSSIW